MGMHVAQVRREHWQEGIDRATTTIAIHERADREAMSQIVEPGTAASQPMGTKPLSHADLGRQTTCEPACSVLMISALPAT
jgi:hypothetical protein